MFEVYVWAEGGEHNQKTKPTWDVWAGRHGPGSWAEESAEDE